MYSRLASTKRRRNCLLYTSYHASKGGVVNLTRALAAEWAKYNITVNAICPGYFVTDFTRDKFETEEFTNHMKIHVPLGRYGKAVSYTHLPLSPPYI